MDEHPGSRTIPLTLNKYLYGNADPVNHVDPSGNFSLGGVMSGIGNMAGLAMRALTIYDLFQNADEIGDSLGLFGTLMVSSIGGPAGFDSLTQNEAALSSALTHMPKSDKHHTIPIYLCGARKQEYAHIEHINHSAIHVKLYAGVIGIRAIANIYQKYLKRPGKGGRKETDPIVVLTKKQWEGRHANADRKSVV